MLKILLGVLVLALFSWFFFSKILPIFEGIKEEFKEEAKKFTNLRHLNSLIKAIKMSEDETIQGLSKELGFDSFVILEEFDENSEGSHEYFVAARSMILSLKTKLPVCFVESDEPAFWEFISPELLIKSLLNKEGCSKCENCQIQKEFEEEREKALLVENSYYDPYSTQTNFG